MMPAWQRVADLRHVAYLDATPDMLRVRRVGLAVCRCPRRLSARIGARPTALEFSDFLVRCTVDLPDDIASLLAWCIMATRDGTHSIRSASPRIRFPLLQPLPPPPPIISPYVTVAD